MNHCVQDVKNAGCHVVISTTCHNIYQYSGFSIIQTLIIRTPKVTVLLLEYFSVSVSSIRVNDCSIRVFE